MAILLTETFCAVGFSNSLWARKKISFCRKTRRFMSEGSHTPDDPGGVGGFQLYNNNNKKKYSYYYLK